MFNKQGFVRWYLLSLFAANLFLLLPNAHLIRIIGAIALTSFLPGLTWTNRFVTGLPLGPRFTVAIALSYTITCLATLLLHYLPGPISSWQLLIALDLLALIPLILKNRSVAIVKRPEKDALFAVPTVSNPLAPVALLLVLLVAFYLRAANLGYSEFQGDEALVMITAAEALEGHEDALFLRSKGPVEVLLPMALWRLSGTINEAVARLPFAMAGILAIITIYLIGRMLGGRRLGVVAVVFFAFNGFMVAFARIVQYQVLVVWLSSLSFLMALYWQDTRSKRFAVLSGLFLGAGLLAHYDAILVLPALVWIFLADIFEKEKAPGVTGTSADRPSNITTKLRRQTITWGSFLVALAISVLPFYLPYAVDPQAGRTGDYVSTRIGSELRNNLSDFFQFNTFYSSFYYIVLTGLLVLVIFIYVLWQAGWNYRLLLLPLIAAVVAVIFIPELFFFPQIGFNASLLPFLLILLAIILALRFSPTHQALIAWLAVPFLGYNFVVALGLTHIYTIVPAWSLLAAMGWYCLFDLPGRSAMWRRSSNLLLSAGILLSTLFLWNAFIRHDVEYWQDYPTGNLSIFWTPYQEPPEAGFFGFVHRAGWKAVGRNIATGILAGDYASNEEPDVTTWYTRGAPRACDSYPEFYYLADDLIDPVNTPADVLDQAYKEIGTVTLPNQKQMAIMQQVPNNLSLGAVEEASAARQFDETATPAAFARSARGSVPADANFGNQIRLVGYDLDTRRAHPGGRIPVTLYWQTLAPISTSYHVFTHLESDAGPIAQSDGVPVCWTYPTDAWRPGQIIADQHALALPPDVAPGQYSLAVGLYLPENFERLEVVDIAGNPAGTSITLDVIEIRDEVSDVSD